MTPRIANWSIVDQNIILGRNDIPGTWITLSDLGHLLRVVGLRPVVKVVELASGLDNENNVIFKSYTISLNVSIPSVFL